MIVESELRDEIRRTIERGHPVDLDDLYEWLSERSWNMHQTSERGSVELAAYVEHMFIWRQDGVLSDAELFDKLRARLAAQELGA